MRKRGEGIKKDYYSYADNSTLWKTDMRKNLRSWKQETVKSPGPIGSRSYDAGVHS